jgi:predicted nucleotide-binding protein
MSSNKLTFLGTPEEWRALLESTDFSGEWLDKGTNGLHFRLRTGPTIVRWQTGTVVVQGKEPTRSEIEDTLRALIDPPHATAASTSSAKKSSQIFVVHGHDKKSRDELELALRRLGLEPFILMNSSGGGKTIIEALEGHIGRDYSSSFGIVLMTPDDRGYAIADGESKIEPRPRQNVVLETGMLLASLTRQRMALLVKGHLELPSDLNGVLYLGFNEHIREVLPKLVTQLKEAGIPVNEAKLAEAMA